MEVGPELQTQLKEIGEKLERHLQSKSAILICPYCNRRNWQVVGLSNAPLVQDKNAMVIGGPAVPVVLVACANCGHIAQFSALMVGAW